MARDHDRILTNRCLKKRSYPDRASAVVAARSHPGLDAYHCPECNGWHVGHAKRRSRGRR